MELGELTTESRNPRSTDLDSMSTAQVLALMNDEDRTVPEAVARVLPAIEQAVELVVRSLREGGRLIYLGAGTSGRLGLLDAVECPPTFSTEPSTVTALLAGGEGAFISSVEGAEDDPARGAQDVDRLQVGPHDTIVGLAASGRTPYVVGGLRRARVRGAATVSVACNEHAVISADAEVAIEVITGPEVLTGSTRLKAGTAQKLICNMISTAAMIRIGKTYGNLMVDVQATNQKLKARAVRIVRQVTGASPDRAEAALAQAGGSAKVAIVTLQTGATPDEARQRLAHAGGFLRRALAEE